MKTIAMYLPQFHRIPENDEWWGEGFTEWTAVKSAKKLFPEHRQPRVPIENYYYNLLDRSTMEWQASLANDYGVEGFCFYHYYFSDGKKILEKPAENLLDWKNLPMNFCFCWANETWARTWSGINPAGMNTWAEVFEKEYQSAETSGILLQQKYGREYEWKAHFDYLLPFFKDERYIKSEDGRPLFLIYKPLDIACLADMIEYWGKLAHENGIKRVYVVGVNVFWNITGLDAILISGPNAYLHSSPSIVVNNVRTFSYEDIWKTAISMPEVKNCKTYFGGFQNYDDTPRRGERGTVLTGADAGIFKKYLCKIAQKNIDAGNELLFINAWNEWGEGMYLEPDTVNGYEFLQAIKTVMSKMDDKRIKEEVVGVNELETMNALEYGEVFIQRDKFLAYYQLFDYWMLLKERGVCLSTYLLEKKFHTIAVYGLGSMGRHFLIDIQDTDIEVRYVMDQNRYLRYKELEFKCMDDNLPPVDALIVTPTFYFDDIKEQLLTKISCPIISLEEIIKESV